MKQYKKYKQRCNDFFMDVVSRLCFYGDEPPTDDVIKKLLSYITKTPGLETSDEKLLPQLTAFKDTIDPTPAVRSFLLQLLLQSRFVSKMQEYESTPSEMFSLVVSGLCRKDYDQ